MSEAGLELLITLDDPRNAQERDAFNHHQAEHAGAYWSGQPDSWGQHDHRAEEIIDNDPHGDFRSGRSDVLGRFQRHDE